MAKPALNVANELGILLNGDALEILIDELTDPGAHFTEGQRARLGAALESIGSRLYGSAKDSLGGIQAHIDQDVIFKWKNGYPKTEVDVNEVKKQYPQKEHPSLYKTSDVAGGITIEVPFDKKEIHLPDRPQDQPSSLPMDDFPDFAQAELALPDPFA